MNRHEFRNYRFLYLVCGAEYLHDREIMSPGGKFYIFMCICGYVSTSLKKQIILEKNVSRNYFFPYYRKCSIGTILESFVS